MAESSSSTGRVVWQTTMAMADAGTNPPIRDEFVSNRWTAEQKNPGLIKYTQYVDGGREVEPAAESSSTGAVAVTALTMGLDESGVEKVDFGWLKQPKFVCFSNCTPENCAGVPIFLGVDNKTIKKDMLGSSSSLANTIPPPLWMVGAMTTFEGYDTQEGWSTLTSDTPLEDIDRSTAVSFAEEDYCQEVFEIPAGVTVGPFIIPPGTTYWAYRKHGGAEDESSSSMYAAILITEAYDA